MTRARIDASVQRKIASIAEDAASRMWAARDRLTVRHLPNGDDEGILWERRVVSFDDVEYLPLDIVSLRTDRTTSLLMSSEGAITIDSATPVLARTWNAALAWRILRRMTGESPELREWIMVPRAPDPYRPEGPIAKVRRLVQPYMKLSDPLDIAVNDLCMHVLEQIVETRPVRTAGGLLADVGHDVVVRQHGRRYGSFHVVDPIEGPVAVPRRLYSTFDSLLNPQRDTVSA